MRPSRHQMFMQMARAAAGRSTCYRLNVGCVLVEDRNVVAIGYNGAPSEQPHCDGNGCRYFTPSGCKVIHAENNALERAIAYAAGYAISVDAYVTHSPCVECAKLLICAPSRGVHPQRVFYETAYRDATPLKMLSDDGLGVYQILPSGLCVDFVTGELCEP